MMVESALRSDFGRRGISLDYMSAFDVLATFLPHSIVAAFAGRHAIEIGLKCLLLGQASDFPKTHNLGELACRMFDEYHIQERYMDRVVDHCGLCSRFIEGGNVEYFAFLHIVLSRSLRGIV